LSLAVALVGLIDKRGREADKTLFVARSGREDRSRKRFDANSPRRVGPLQVEHIGLRAAVDFTEPPARFERIILLPRAKLHGLP